MTNQKELDIANVFSKYFDYPHLTKVKMSDEDDSCVYMAKTSKLTANRYVCVVSNPDVFPIGSTRPMIDLRWRSIQTRTIKDTPTVKVNCISYTPKRDFPYDSSIHSTDKNSHRTLYSCDGVSSITITLLHPSESAYYYSETGALNMALETYNTIITMSR
jgi:hypothetical protein